MLKQKFWNEYDLTEREQVVQVFAQVFDLADKSAGLIEALMRDCYKSGWTAQALQKVQRQAYVKSKYASKKWVKLSAERYGSALGAWE